LEDLLFPVKPKDTPDKLKIHKIKQSNGIERQSITQANLSKPNFRPKRLCGSTGFLAFSSVFEAVLCAKEKRFGWVRVEILERCIDSYRECLFRLLAG
jgi:hypothetical protein